MAVLVRSFGVEPGEEFGVAPTALGMRREEERCARY